MKDFGLAVPQELLSRPPPKFVHDVAVLVRQAGAWEQLLLQKTLAIIIAKAVHIDLNRSRVVPT